MLTRYLLVLMLTLSTFQSVAAVSDVHQNHQSGTEHMEFDHDVHEHIDKELNTSDFDVGSPDCHHCCHCHPAHVPSMVPLSFILEFGIAQCNLSSAHNSRLLKRQYTFLRPPQV